MSLHSLEETPEVEREYLVIEHGELDLVIRAGSYQEVEKWLAGELVHTKWINVMGFIAACKTAGSFMRFDIPYLLKFKTVVIVRTVARR